MDNENISQNNTSAQQDPNIGFYRNTKLAVPSTQETDIFNDQLISNPHADIHFYVLLFAIVSTGLYSITV